MDTLVEVIIFVVVVFYVTKGFFYWVYTGLRKLHPERKEQITVGEAANRSAWLVTVIAIMNIVMILFVNKQH